jgi:hypothetical protein
MNDIVFKFFGECEIDRDYDTTIVYSNKEFVIICSKNQQNYTLLSVGMQGYFDKQKDCPLQILIGPEEKISRRKKKRIFNAINYMLRNKDDLTSWGDLEGFDDLGRDNFLAFYRMV